MRSRVGVRGAAAVAMLCLVCAPVAGQAGANAPSQEQTARWMATILARPLFNPDRAPAPVPDVTRTEPAPRLTATLLGPFGNRAIFEIDGKAVALAEGEHIGPWTVAAIAAGTVTLSQLDRSHVLALAFAAPRQDEPRPQTGAAVSYWSNPCGRSHARNPAGRATSLQPDLCEAAPRAAVLERHTPT